MNSYDNILRFYEEYIKLEQIIRKGWLMRNVPSKRLESVADHTLQLLMLASVITKELNIEVDLAKLMEMLLVHDLGEIIIGDVSEVEENRNEKKKKEKEAVRTILNNLSTTSADYYFSLWCEMEQQNTDFSKLALLIDKIDAVIKAGVYERQFKIKGLFEEFFNWQKRKNTFDNTQLEDLYDFIFTKFN